MVVFSSRTDIVKYFSFMKGMSFFIKNSLLKKDITSVPGVFFYKDRAYCVVNHVVGSVKSPGINIVEPIFWSFKDEEILSGTELLSRSFDLNFRGYPVSEVPNVNLHFFDSVLENISSRYSEEYLIFYTSEFQEILSTLSAYTPAKLAKLSVCIKFHMGYAKVKIMDRKNHSDVLKIFSIKSLKGNVDVSSTTGSLVNVLYFFNILSFGFVKHTIISMKLLNGVVVISSLHKNAGKRSTEYFVVKEPCEKKCDYKL